MRLIQIVSLTLLMAMVSACQVMDPYTGESKTSKATTYGLGAAIVCGLIGATESSKRARNAAAGCGAIGVGVGAYMDHQEKVLRDQLVDSGVQVERNGNTINLIMPDKITFETDRYDLKPSFTKALDSIVLVLNKYPDTRLSVVGHTDSVGAESYNLELSRKRASAVANYLLSHQVASPRVSTSGAGESQPVASNNTAEGRAQNRRVELSIVPLEPVEA